MIKFCPYCSMLHKAIANQNYCSKMGDAISEVKTNAYYFKTNKLYSGEHVSRLSIRTISDGYQYHKVNNQDLMLSRDNYLLIREGEAFYSEISTKKNVEGLLVAFEKNDVQSINNYINSRESQLLDDPFETISDDIPLDSQTISISNDLKLLMFQLKYGIVTQIDYKLYYEELFMKILKTIFKDQDNINERIKKIKAKKYSTKKEIFRRVRKAKDYLDGNLGEDLSIKKLSQVATMSPFHFVRSFKDSFKYSPHAYITKQRISKAKYLLQDSNDTIGEICQQVGILNSSSFIRLFKEYEGCTPNNYRTASA